MSISIGELSEKVKQSGVDASTPITDEEAAKLKERFKEIVFALYMKYPFYGIIMHKCYIVATRGVPVAGVTQQGKVLVNPVFLDLPPVMQQAIMVHEFCHLAYLHHHRVGGRDPKIWNMATDYIINRDVVHDFGDRDVLPSDALYDNSVGLDMDSEKLYAALEDKMKPPHFGSGGSGGSSRNPVGEAINENNPDIDELTDRAAGQKNPWEDLQSDPTPGGEENEVTVWEGSDEVPETEQEWKEATSEAYQHAKMQGSVPRGAENLVGDLLEPKVKWNKRVVASVSREMTRDELTDFTYSIPNRRFMQSKVIIPEMVGTVNKGAVAIDTSGSMCNYWRQCVADMEHIRKQFSVDLYLMWCDSAVYSHGWIKPRDPLPKVSEGGGGTSFRPPFDYVKEHGIDRELDFMLYFTDGYGGYPQKPQFRTIWVMYTDENPPFGELIKVDA